MRKTDRNILLRPPLLLNREEGKTKGVITIVPLHAEENKKERNKKNNTGGRKPLLPP